MQRQAINEPVRKIESWSSGDLNRKQGRPKMTQGTGVDNYMNDLNLQINIVKKIRMNGEERSMCTYVGRQPQFVGIKVLTLLC